MNILSHFNGACKKEIESLKEQLKDSQAQNIAYMQDLTEVTCKLRSATLAKQKDCSDCVENKKESVVE
jgi:hypothetical protein